MGTRGLIGFRFNQQDFLAYNHFDSYPDSLGQIAVEMAAKVASDIGGYVDKLSKLRAIDTSKDLPTNEDKKRCRALKLVDLKVSNQSEDDWYCLLRNAQGEPLKYLEAGVFPVGNEFAADSLFCEYAYILNLDTKEIEFYEGFNSDAKANGRYAALKRDEDSGYAGIQLVGEAPLNDIPTDWQERFYPEPDEE